MKTRAEIILAAADAVREAEAKLAAAKRRFEALVCDAPEAPVRKSSTPLGKISEGIVKTCAANFKRATNAPLTGAELLEIYVGAKPRLNQINLPRSLLCKMGVLEKLSPGVYIAIASRLREVAKAYDFPIESETPRKNSSPTTSAPPS